MLDPNNPENFTHWFTHHLVIALRFVDVFTRRPVDTPLGVTIPELGWKVVHRTTDSTYRIMATEAPVSTGTIQTFEVIVEDPDQRYVNHWPVTFTLPRASAMPPLSRAGYLDEHVLWPTRKLRVPTGETAVIGNLVSNTADPVDHLDVRLFPAGETPPDGTFARTNQDGEFLFRMPELSRDLDGTHIPSITRPQSLDVQVDREGSSVGPVTPSSLSYEPGRLQSVTFAIP